ncbi:MAG: HsdM family class I SAM-dependent methyltransferase, partial [Planctomycetota bacterium]
DARPIGRPVDAEHAARFFEENSRRFAPREVYRAKTWARFDRQLQLPFVDVDLLPVVEREAGTALTRLIEEEYAGLQRLLGWTKPDASQEHWMLKSVFWLVSAKMLRDKGVEAFSGLDLRDVKAVFERVAQHHSSTVTAVNRSQLPALTKIASDIAGFPSLRFATTEALAFVYENAMITEAIRDELGTHSTPAYLVDYIVGRLAPWIEDIDVGRRNVFEPACGHAGFLVAAMRVLTELLPTEKSTASNRRAYLRSRIHGCEIDPFALEIARLSLTLADIPNPDGWDLSPEDMFATDVLERQSKSASILLANPPFMNFSAEEQKRYGSAGRQCSYRNKAAEMLRRTLPNLAGGSCFGVIVPQGFLHSRNAVELRREALKEYQIDEILLFPDKVFAFSDMESAVVIGRKRIHQRKVRQVRHRSVRERGMDEFRGSYIVSTERTVPESRFQTHECDLRVPELEEVWDAAALLPHRLCDLADVGRGFSPKSRRLLKGRPFYFDTSAKGRVPVLHRFPRGIRLHELPKEEWADLSSDYVEFLRRAANGAIPQVVFNYFPTSRGPWRLKALIDSEGHAISHGFVVVRPESDKLPLEFFWAILNSPMANAYAYCHLRKRHNTEGTMRELRVPDAPSSRVRGITNLVQQYFTSAETHGRPLLQKGRAASPQELLVRIDAAVLDLYDLPAGVERELLDLFRDWQRGGVPFAFDRYFPAHFKESIHLRELIDITYDWAKTNRRRNRLIHREVDGTITDEESEELERLQRLADLRTDLLDPLDLEELEQLHAEIVTPVNG